MDGDSDSDEPPAAGRGLAAYQAVVLAGGSVRRALESRVAQGIDAIEDPVEPGARAASGEDEDDDENGGEGDNDDGGASNAGDSAARSAVAANPNDAADGDSATSAGDSDINADGAAGEDTASGAEGGDGAEEAADAKQNGDVECADGQPTKDDSAHSDTDSVGSDESERALRQAAVGGKPFLAQRVSEILGWYNDNTVPTLASLGQPRPAAMPLVLFEEAVSHVCRVVRLLRMPGRHAMLMGVGGSGKRSVTKLAAFAAARFAVHLADAHPAQDGTLCAASRAPECLLPVPHRRLTYRGFLVHQVARRWRWDPLESRWHRCATRSGGFAVRWQ